MSDQLFSAEVLEKAVKPAPARKDWYVVVGYWAPGGWWGLRKEEWLTEEAARKAAEKLPKGWTHYEIVRIPAHSKVMASKVPQSFMLIGFYGEEGSRPATWKSRSSLFGVDATLAQAWCYMGYDPSLPDEELREIQMFPRVFAEAKDTPDETPENESMAD